MFNVEEYIGIIRKRKLIYILEDVGNEIKRKQCE